MFTKLTTLLLAALQISLAAAGNAIISNNCPYDVWVWSCGAGISSSPIHIASRQQYSEPLRSGGVSLKVSKTSQLTGGAQTQFEYTIVNNQLWYDISFVDCAQGQNAAKCPGQDLGLSMVGGQKGCGSVHCQAGSYCPTQAYYVDQPLLKLGLAEPVFTCPGAGVGMDLTMKVCADAAPSKRSIAGRVLVEFE